MKTINQKTQLATKITLLKSKQTSDFIDLKNQYHITIDSFKPINLIKNSLEDAITLPNLKANLISGVLGFGTRYLTENIFTENSQNPVKRIFGKVVKFAIKKFI